MGGTNSKKEKEERSKTGDGACYYGNKGKDDGKGNKNRNKEKGVNGGESDERKRKMKKSRGIHGKGRDRKGIARVGGMYRK